MLHKPDVHTAKILALADFIEGLEPDRFDMKTFGSFCEPRCICGWLLHNEAHIDKGDINLAADILGIEYTTARELFGGDVTTMHYTTTEAASILRHLAVTGEMP